MKKSFAGDSLDDKDVARFFYARKSATMNVLPPI